MAALNMQETESLSLAERAMNDTANRLARMLDADDIVGLDKIEVEFMITSLRKAKGLVNTVKQMKGYYPK